METKRVHFLRYLANGKYLLVQTREGTIIFDSGSDKGKEALRTNLHVAGISDCGQFLYNTNCQCSSTDNVGKTVVPLNMQHVVARVAFRKDLALLVSKMGVVYIYEKDKCLASTTITGHTVAGFRDNDSCFVFDYGKGAVACWNFRQEDRATFSSVSQRLYEKAAFEWRKLEELNYRVSPNGFLFTFFGTAIHIRDLLLKEEDVVAKEERGRVRKEEIEVGGSGELEVDERGEFAMVYVDSLLQIIDTRTAERVLSRTFNGGYCVAITPDFTKIVYAKREKTKRLEFSSLLSVVADVALGLCFSELPPYVILLICDLVFALKEGCSLQVAERWQHKRKVDFIWSLVLLRNK